MLPVCNISENNMQEVSSMYYMNEDPNSDGLGSWGRKLPVEHSCLVVSCN
jgi:hypothetical protein